MNQRHRGYKTPGLFGGCLPWVIGGAFIALTIFWAINSSR